MIKILTDGFGDPSSLIRILKHIFKSLLIMQQFWREETGFGMSSWGFFSPENNSGFSKKEEGKGSTFLVKTLFWDCKDLTAGFHFFFFFLVNDCLQSK